MKLTEKGSPEAPAYGQDKDHTKINYPTRVKDHPVWSHEEKPWRGYEHKTQHHSIENHYFYRTAKMIGGGNYANLGVFRGGSVYCLAHGLKAAKASGTIYGIDIFNKQNGASDPEDLMQIYKRAGVDSYVKFCTGFTNDWAEKLSHLKFKFILIDADHNYETCRQDFDLWSPLVEDGGLLVFHDVNIITVDKVVTEALTEGWELVDHVAVTKTLRRCQ